MHLRYAEPPRLATGSSRIDEVSQQDDHVTFVLNHWVVMCSELSIKPTIATVGVGSIGPLGL